MSGLPTGVGHSHVRRSRYRQNVDTRMGARGEKSVVGAPDTPRAPDTPLTRGPAEEVDTAVRQKPMDTT